MRKNRAARLAVAAVFVPAALFTAAPMAQATPAAPAIVLEDPSDCGTDGAPGANATAGTDVNGQATTTPAQGGQGGKGGCTGPQGEKGEKGERGERGPGVLEELLGGGLLGGGLPGLPGGDGEDGGLGGLGGIVTGLVDTLLGGLGSA